MTLLEDPLPVTTASPAPRPAPPAGRPGAWRFAARLARRETRRRPGRTALASLLIAVPVVGMTLGSVFVRTETGDWADQFQRRFGAADIALDPSMTYATNVDEPAVELPPGTQVDEYLWTSSTISTRDALTPTVYAWLSDVDLSDPMHGDPVEVVSGRAPVAGEMLVSRNLASALGLDVGDTIALERPSGEWRISGFGRVRDSYFNDVIVIPGFDRARLAPGYEQTVTLYRLPAGTSQAEIQRTAAELDGVTRFVDPFAGDAELARGMAWGWVAGVLALFGVGIIVAAAFATSARRQLVTIGQLTSNGATEQVVRRTLAMQGTWTGLVGACLGVAAGLAALPFARPIVAQYLLHHDVAPWRIGAVDLVVIALTATVAGTVAAAVPARSAARVPVMSALAGRRPLGSLPTWLVPTGLVLLGGGLGFIALAALGINGASSGRSDDVWALLIVLGVIGVVVGMCCATPLVIERIGGLGRRTSLSWRLALRSIVRSRTRSSAVVAAIAVAAGASVAAGSIVETMMRENLSWNQVAPSDTIVIEAIHAEEYGVGSDAADQIVDAGPLPSAPVSAELRDEILSIAPGATITPIRVATIDPAPFDTATGGIWPDPNGPRIADPALIAIMGLADVDVDALQSTGSLDPISTWELARSDEFGVQVLQYETAGGVIDVSPTRATVPFEYDIADWGMPLATEQYARDLGFDIVERGAIVRAPRALTVDQLDQIRDLQMDLYGAQLDGFIEPGDPPRPGMDVPTSGEQWNVTFDDPRFRSVDERDVWVARLVIFAAALLITALVVSIGLSLAAAEGRDERNVLAVVGATPASMRRQASARAAVLAFSGIALGIPTGFLPTWVLYTVLNTNSRLSTEPLRFPWLIMVGLLVVVPAVVAVAAWVAAGVAQRVRPASPTRRD